MRCLSGFSRVVGVTLALACAGCAPPTWEDPLKSREEILSGVEALEAFIGEQVARRGLGRVSVALVSGNELVYAKAFGAEPTDRLRAGSISKVASAYAALQLVASGRLALDEPLGASLPQPYVPNAALAEQITLRRVLTHTSGLRNDATGDDRTVYFAPGSVVHYSGGGFEYLSAALEAVVGMPLDRYMESTVLPQLGMADSAFSIPELDQYAVSAAYSLQSTPSDVARLFMELLDPAHADRELIAEMVSPAVKVTDRYAWGLGVGVQAGRSGEAIWHWGDFDEFQSLAVLFKSTRTGAVVMTEGRAGAAVNGEIIHQAIGGEHYGYAAALPPGFGW